jgi:hypothetical protein
MGWDFPQKNSVMLSSSVMMSCHPPFCRNVMVAMPALLFSMLLDAHYRESSGTTKYELVHLATKAFTPSAVGITPLICSSHIAQEETVLAPKGTNKQDPTTQEAAPKDERGDLLILDTGLTGLEERIASMTFASQTRMPSPTANTLQPKSLKHKRKIRNVSPLRTVSSRDITSLLLLCCYDEKLQPSRND